MNIFCKKINFYIRLCGFAIELQIQVTTQHPLRSSPALIGICNPDVYNVRIFNPLIALQMLIFYACGLQIRTSAAAII